MLSCLLGQEGDDTRASGVFYVAVVQSILIFGSDSWVIMPCIMQALGSLYNWVIRKISGLMPWCQNGKWEYPPIGETLMDLGLGTIGGYITCHHNSTAQYICYVANF